MTDRKDGGFKIDRQTALFGIDEGLARGKAEFGCQLGSTDLPTGDTDITNRSRGTRLDGACGDRMTPVGPARLIARLRQRNKEQFATMVRKPQSSSRSKVKD